MNLPCGTPEAGGATLSCASSGAGSPSLWALLSVGAAAVCLFGAGSAMRRDRERRGRTAALLGAGRAPCQGARPAWWAWRIRRWGTGPAALRRGREAAAVRGGAAAGGGVAARDAAAVLGAGAAALALFGGVPGLLAGPAVAYAVAHRLRQHRREARGRKADTVADQRASAQLPLAAELLAACLAAGSGPPDAAGAVGASLGGPLGERLLRAAAELRLGGEPAVVWERFGALPGAAGLGRRMERAGVTGVPAVASVGRLAADCRARRRRLAQARARRAGVLVTGPLGLCFLPAFLLVGVVPVVIGLARSLL